ncbi:MAG TPA: DUF937 domain-containing protein, partial [Hyphomicrobiaceae bacterium]|nr:DUF937 domain-containing protein [Hyphomicrobiaceae bacterium]
MSDLVDAVSSEFGPATRERLAKAMGVTPATVERLFAGGIPALLASLAAGAGDTAGPRLLASVLDQRRATGGDDLADAIGTTRQQAITDEGRSAIGTLLGSPALGQLAGVLSKFSATGIGNAATALSLAMPSVLDVLERERTGQDLDTDALGDLLFDQRRAIAESVPDTLRPLLAETGLVDGLERDDRPRSTQRAAPKHREQAASAPGTPSRSEFSWPGWIAAIAAASVMWWSVFGERALSLATGAQSQTVSRLAGLPERIMVGDVDLAAETHETLAMLTAMLSGVRGEVTARSSIPKLTEVSVAMERLRNLSGRLPQDGRRRFAAIVAGHAPGVNAAFASAEAAPGA